MALFLFGTVRAEAATQSTDKGGDATTMEEAALSTEAEAERMNRALTKEEQATERQSRNELYRFCQDCPGRAFEFKFTIAVWAALVALQGSSSTEEDDGDGEETRPQLLSFNPGLTYAFIGETDINWGPIGFEAVVYGGGLGAHPVVSAMDQSGEIGRIEVSVMTGHGAIKWHINPLPVHFIKHDGYVALRSSVGMRFASLFVSVQAQREAIFLDGSVTWSEPAIGLETVVDPLSRWSFRLSSDVCGFTAGCDIRVWLAAHGEYHFARWFSLSGGWNFYWFQTRPDRMLIDEIEFFLHGPALAIRLTLQCRSLFRFFGGMRGVHYGVRMFAPRFVVAVFVASVLQVASSEECGNSTQMIWADTRRVGCASSASDSGWGAHNDPRRNFVGQRPF